MSRSRASLIRDDAFVRHERGGWSEVFPVEKLDERIALYEGLRDRIRRLPGHERAYVEDVEALHAVRDVLRGRT